MVEFLQKPAKKGTLDFAVSLDMENMKLWTILPVKQRAVVWSLVRADDADLRVNNSKSWMIFG